MSMNKKPCKFISGYIAGALLAFAGMVSPLALAAPIYSVDTLLGSATLANSGDDEVEALRAYADDATLTRTQLSAAGVAVGANSQWFIDVGLATPGYFVLKFGTGTTNQHTHFFFKNDGAVGNTKLVWTDAQVNFLTGGGNCHIPDAIPPKNPKTPDLTSCNITRLSHFGFGGVLPDDGVPPTETDIPEPGSLALAGLALLGLFAARKKRVQ